MRRLSALWMLIAIASPFFLWRVPLASAQCVNSSDVITCDGTVTTGATGTSTTTDIIVNEGATITNTTGDIAVDGSAGDTDVTNNGTADGQFYGIVTWEGDITNNGSASGDNIAINSFSGDITNNGTVHDTITGLYSFEGDITNNGTVESLGYGIFGDTGTITNHGQVDSDYIGISSFDSQIINTGNVNAEVGVFQFDGSLDNQGEINGTDVGVICFNGDVINSGTITGDLAAIQCVGNADNTVINMAGGEINGLIDAGGETSGDTLLFQFTVEAEDLSTPAEYAALQAQIQAIDLTHCPCTLGMTVNGLYFEYTFINFEFVESFLNLIQITFTPYQEMSCQNGVRCFALKDKAFRNGNVQIYAAEGDQGVGVTTVNFRLLGTGGYTYTNPDNGWTVTISYLGTEGDALTYDIVLSRNGEVRNAMITVLAFQYQDQAFATHALAWR